MKSTIQSATAILGPELVKAFNESCRGNKREVEQLMHEALRALRFVRLNEDWQDDNLLTNLHD